MPLAEAKVGILDIGLLRGYAIYEALAVYNGRPFMFDDHMARFRRSAEAMRLTIPATNQKIAEAISALLKRNKLTDARIKFLLTGGETVDGIDYKGDKLTFFILAEPFDPLPKKIKDHGCTLISYEFQRQFPEYKTSNYITGVWMQPARRKAGALEILFTWQGRVLECSTSNFFIVKNGAIITAARDILSGITRKAVLRLAKHSGMKVEERDLGVSELATADEAFITSSFKEIVPVIKIDNVTIGNGKPGVTTKKLATLFEHHVAEVASSSVA